MWESLVVGVLSSYLGEYVEGLDAENLRISLVGGRVTLRDLRLRAGALDSLDLPIQVTYGRLGVLDVEIPWKNLGSKPARVTIDEVGTRGLRSECVLSPPVLELAVGC
jgi:vacuolar protein sorting-associated protein 13A/C